MLQPKAPIRRSRMAKQTLSFQQMQRVLIRAKSEAGRRYLPGVQSGFPTVRIESLTNAIDGLARNENFWNRLARFQTDLSATRKGNLLIRDGAKVPREIAKGRSLYRGLLTKCELFVSRSLDQKGGFSPIQLSSKNLSSRLDRAYQIVSDYIYRRRQELGPETPMPSGDPRRVREELDSLNRQHSDLYDTVREIIDFVRGDSFALCNNPIGLLTGPAGSGKTHFLCDVAEHRLASRKPTLIFIARNMRVENNDLLSSVAASIDRQLTVHQLIKSLRREAHKSRERVLIFIDAVNEAHRGTWKKLIVSYLNGTNRVPEIGLVLSFRTPYQHLMLAKSHRAGLVNLYHPGFSGIEYRAQEVIFGAYNLPLPEVPLLSEEFANPLFLISFCETLSQVTHKQRHKQIREISSGQKGMTKVLEDFLKVKQAEITRSVNQATNGNAFCSQSWLWGSGRQRGIVKDLAHIMACRRERYAFLSEFEDVLESYLTNRAHVGLVKDQLIAGGVFLETIVWEDGHPHDAVVINYQKFSDHLIVRSLLDGIDVHDASEVCKLYNEVADDPGLLEALMVEFPHRSGRELLLIIPEADVSIRAMKAFVSGLYWRSPDSFGNDTLRLVNWVFAQKGLSIELHEALVSLATKRDHPYNSLLLDRYLRRYSLVDRDLVWSEYLRQCDRTSAPEKLVNWVLQTGMSRLPWDVATHYVTILSWILTTTRRQLRDLATKALVEIGLVFPKGIADHVLTSLSVNDPYVPERMLAVLYGVWMRKLPYITVVDSVEARILCTTALSLYKAMFLPKSPHGTTHVLTRDYARRVILCAFEIQPALLRPNQIKRITPPFSYGGIRKWGRSRDKDDGKYRDGSAPMHMDFSNYTLGRLVRNRQNYDFDHADFKRVKENIFWRIYKLGYKYDQFARVDAEIASMQYWSGRRNAGKIDRYGKKYCWIAYFELYGSRQDRMLLDDLEYGDYIHRPSDCDIDPSFPAQPHPEPFCARDFLGNRKAPTPQWIKRAKVPVIDDLLICDTVYGYPGPWVLLDSYIRQEDILTKRDFGLWVHSCLVPSEEISLFLSLPYDGEAGASAFAATSHTTNTYAGEVPWADTWSTVAEDHLEFEKGWEEVTEKIKRLAIIKEGKRLSVDESDRILGEYLSSAGDDNPASKVIKRLQDEGMSLISYYETKKAKRKRRIRIKAENAVHDFLWESYHSDVNGSRNITLPSRAVCETLGLRMTIPDWDFVDRSAQKAIIVIKAGKEYGGGQDAIYIRRDLLDHYLELRKSHLVWSVSGERRPLYKDDQGGFRMPGDEEKIRRTFQKTLIYENGGCSQLSAKSRMSLSHGRKLLPT